MARVVVDVMPKPEILDPQGKAVLGALPRLGFSGVTDVRQGKRFELEIEGEPSEELLDQARRMAQTLLSNPVIEDFRVTLVDSGGSASSPSRGRSTMSTPPGRSASPATSRWPCGTATTTSRASTP